MRAYLATIPSQFHFCVRSLQRRRKHRKIDHTIKDDREGSSGRSTTCTSTRPQDVLRRHSTCTAQETAVHSFPILTAQKPHMQGQGENLKLHVHLAVHRASFEAPQMPEPGLQPPLVAASRPAARSALGAATRTGTRKFNRSLQALQHLPICAR